MAFFATGCILTYSGALVNVLYPHPDTIRIEDIIHSLCFQCRYNGHCSDFYSVGEHSVHVSHLVDPEFALCALLHDASEAYLCDIPRPIKHLLTNYRELEVGLERVIAEKFGLLYPLPSQVKTVDGAMLLPERDRLGLSADGDWTGANTGIDLRGKVDIACYTPDMARHHFWRRFKELT